MVKKYFLLLATIFVAATTQQASAQWEKIQALPAAQCIMVAPNGNLISSDFQFDYSGGIYYSQDKGATWIKAEVEDYAYNTMIQAGEYIIASGEYSTLARSKDNGVTWETLNYSYILSEYISEGAAEGDMAYAITYFKDKLFIADMNGGGAMYSEDFGETWTMTDRQSLMYETEYGPAIDSFYKFDQNNGQLLLFGAFFVYRLNEENYTWELLRSDSNFMGVTTTYQNKLICGRAITNYTDKVPFLEYTEDGGSSWGEVPRPEGMIDNNVRAMHCFDNTIIVALQQGGLYFTNDFGQTWDTFSDGIPYYVSNDTKYYKSPLVIDSDDQYVYIALYDEPWNEPNEGGIYRYDKSMLKASVNTTIHNNNVYVHNNTLYLNDSANVTIYNLNGSLVYSANNCQEIDLNNLQEGIYIYQANINNDIISGKFIKK